MSYRDPATPGAPVWTIGDAELDAAIATVAQHLLPTPLVPASSVHPRLWLKLETKQLTGSFKVRGALAKLASLPAEVREAGIVTASAGNHGLGVAYAGRVLGVRARVYVPAHTPEIKKRGIAASGAEVIVTEHEGYDATEAHARAIAEEEGVSFVSPYDDPLVAAGNGGTLGMELFSGVSNLDAVVCPVGGGGLVAGLVAARARSGSSARIVGVNAAASPGMARSLEEGRAVETLDPVETLAEGLEGGVCASTFAAVRDGGVPIVTVEEDAIAKAMQFARTQFGEVVEGSGAVGLAYVLEGLEQLPAPERPGGLRPMSNEPLAPMPSLGGPGDGEDEAPGEEASTEEPAPDAPPAAHPLAGSGNVVVVLTGRNVD